jgi:hypothetical protein
MKSINQVLAVQPEIKINLIIMETIEKTYKYCIKDQMHCYKYLVTLDVWQVLGLTFLVFLALFIVLRIFYFFTADSEIF